MKYNLHNAVVLLIKKKSTFFFISNIFLLKKNVKNKICTGGELQVKKNKDYKTFTLELHSYNIMTRL